jgi:hypothetical protein
MPSSYLVVSVLSLDEEDGLCEGRGLEDGGVPAAGDEGWAGRQVAVHSDGDPRGERRAPSITRLETQLQYTIYHLNEMMKCSPHNTKLNTFSQ